MRKTRPVLRSRPNQTSFLGSATAEGGNSKQIHIPKIAEILKNEYSAPFETLIILSFEIVSDFGFRASDFIIPLTNIAESLVKNARFLFIVVRITKKPDSV